MSPNRIFMFLINPPGGNVRMQKLIAKHIFECFEKRKEEDGKSKYCNLFVSFSYLEISCSRYTIYCIIWLQTRWGQMTLKCVINGKFALFRLFLTKLCTLPWIGVLIFWREKRCQNVILWRHIWWRHKNGL